jgi:hypothetical protein
VAGLFSPYERMRRAAKKDPSLSREDREEMQRKYMEERGKDKWRALRAAAPGLAVAGAGPGAYQAHQAQGFPVGRSAARGAAALLAATGLTAAGLSAAVSEVRRRQAAAGAKDPAAVRAETMPAFPAARLKKRSRLIRDRMAALRGEKPSKAMFRGRSAQAGRGDLD